MLYLIQISGSFDQKRPNWGWRRHFHIVNFDVVTSLNIFWCKVIYQRVLSSGRVQIDLWYKGLRVLCTTSFSNNFSLFQFSTWNKNHFLQTMLPSLLTVFMSIPFNKLPCSDGSSLTSDSTGWWPKRLSTLASLTSIGLTKVFWQYSLLCLPFTSTEIKAGSCLALAWAVCAAELRTVLFWLVARTGPGGPCSIKNLNFVTCSSHIFTKN